MAARSYFRLVILAAVLTVLAGTPAFADATVFVGANTTPANRTVTGLAIGAGLPIIVFEFEFASTSEDLSAGAPSLKIGSVNLLLQTPRAIGGVQPYFTTGAGIFSESLGTIHDETSFAPNMGGGLKLSLVGPLRLRVDYRVFRLGRGALYSPAHRVYVGLNLKF